MCWLYGYLTFPLSHSSQVKTWYQREIEGYEQVSDECSSGVMRAWHVAQSIPDVCSMSAGDS